LAQPLDFHGEAAFRNFVSRQEVCQEPDPVSYRTVRESLSWMVIALFVRIWQGALHGCRSSGYLLGKWCRTALWGMVMGLHGFCLKMRRQHCHLPVEFPGESLFFSPLPPV
jgi:hypothetical protein